MQLVGGEELNNLPGRLVDFGFLLFLIKVAGDHAHSSPGPQPLVPVLSKGKLLNNNILIVKTDFF